MGMSEAQGIHHIAIMTADMKGQLTFFSQVMGFGLVALFPMHGVPGGRHAFLDMGGNSWFSLVELDGVGAIPATIGITHAGTGAGVCAAGTLQHVAFKVADHDALIAMRNRIRAHGIAALGPIGHGFCQSIYFAGPEGLTLEVSCPMTELLPDRWIDPAVLTQCGISADEAERMRYPGSYDFSEPVPQPAFDPAKPRMAYPEAQWQAMLAAPDAAITGAGSYNEPPVPA
jgi:catechol 2,3-dioxygenase-like lactoylglutathione lyase family enzyme